MTVTPIDFAIVLMTGLVVVPVIEEAEILYLFKSY